jgi:N-carbamoyl-L-amino-acid hydrolase
VPDGGAYDGPLGVVSAFAAVDLMREQGVVPARPLGVVSFTDEEGARFGIACAGSRLLTGALPAERGLALTDGDGVPMATAMRSAGLDPSGVGRDDEVLRMIGTFIELHVEQGRGLVDLDRPIAVGSSILAHGRWRLELAGQANHAGTTRLEDRRDPMIDLAAAVTAARSAARARGCVATVGKVAVIPNGVNAIPSAVTAWLDARGDAARAVAVDVGHAAGTAPAEESYTPDTRFDPTLVTRLSRLLGDAPVLGTGAGHDAGILAAAGVPTAMIFVRNPTGVSHSPAEHAEAADCERGVDALARVLADLTG